MKWLKGIGIAVSSLIMLILAIIIFEIYGMYANDKAADLQTEKLKADLISKIPDIEIISVYSEAKNASGTGDHVECVSDITFSTEMTESEIERVMSEHYNSNNEYCRLSKEPDGSYSFYKETSAPFPKNIKGC